MRFPFVQGITGARVYRLVNDGVAVDIQGMTVELLLRDPTGTQIAFTTPKVVNLDDGTDALRGQVQVNLAATDVVAETNYAMRFRVTDGLATKDLWPDDTDPDFLDVGTS